jgi:hypothetical protein
LSAFVEHYQKPDTTKNWLLGEDVVRRGGAVRDMMTPGNAQQPAAMSQYRNTAQDNGGVHINSGIINNAAYLMTVGGTNPASKVEVKYGIGWEKAEKLWYRANTRYFLQTTSFAQAAQAVMQAAQDIGLTENEQNIVECAWKAVGIASGECAALVDPQGTTAEDPTPPDDDEPIGEDPSVDDPSDDTGDAPQTMAPSRRTPVRAQPNGCNAGASGGDFAPTFGVLAALLLGERRRRVRA